MMIQMLKDWLAARVAGYTFAFAQWQDSPANYGTKFVVIQATGGSATEVDLRRARFRVLFFGQRGERGQSQALMQEAEALIQATLADAGEPCGAARVRAIGEYIGPAFTNEDRAWVQMDFEIYF